MKKEMHACDFCLGWGNTVAWHADTTQFTTLEVVIKPKHGQEDTRTFYACGECAQDVPMNRLLAQVAACEDQIDFEAGWHADGTPVDPGDALAAWMGED